MKTVGICGNIKTDVYDDFVQCLRVLYNVYDFADGIGVTTMEDLRDCVKLYVIGKEEDLSEETWDLVSWAFINGVTLVPVHRITVNRIRFHAIKFLRTFADALEKME